MDDGHPSTRLANEPPWSNPPSARSLSWVGCLAANAIALVIVWAVDWNLGRYRFIDPDIIVSLAIQLAIFTFFALWLVCGVPNRRFKWIVGLLGSIAFIGASYAQMRISSENGFSVPAFVVVHIFVSALIAVIPLRLMGLHLSLGVPFSSEAKWQFSIRTILAATVVAAIYTAAIMNLLQDGVLFKLGNKCYPEATAPPEGVMYVGILVLTFVAALVVAVYLRFWIAAEVGIVLGLSASVPYCASTITETATDPWMDVAGSIGLLIAAPAVIALPWSLAGYRPFLGKPFFER